MDEIHSVIAAGNVNFMAAFQRRDAVDVAACYIRDADYCPQMRHQCDLEER